MEHKNGISKKDEEKFLEASVQANSLKDPSKKYWTQTDERWYQTLRNLLALKHNSSWAPIINNRKRLTGLYSAERGDIGRFHPG